MMNSNFNKHLSFFRLLYPKMLSQHCSKGIKKVPILLLTISLLLISTLSFAQVMIDVKGSVTDEQGDVLVGVGITLIGGKAVAITDANGNFTIKVPAEKSVLRISYVGYNTIERTADGNNLVIKLTSNNTSLNEVIVVGYGTQRVSDLTGAVASVKMGNAKEGAYSNFQQIIAGRVAGVNVSETSGQPGAGLSIEVRGPGSLNFSTQPLYVIDGIPIDIPDAGALNANANALGAGGSSPLSAINPADISSIEILKDASATAIYGSRGSNGVVLITTKSGLAGKPKINVSFTNGFSTIGKYLNTLNSQDYANFSNEAYANRKLTTGVPFTEQEILNLPNYNAQRSLTQTGQTRDLNVSVSGGDTKSKYYLSGQYFNQGGVIRNTKLARYNFKVNYQNNITQKIDLSINLNLSRTAASGNVANSFAGGYLNSAVVWAPVSPLVNPDGTYNVIRTYQYGTTNVIDPNAGSIFYNSRFPLTDVLGLIDLGFNNPLAFVNAITNDNTSTQILGNLTLNYNINKSLKWSNVSGVTTYNSLLENYIPTTVPRSYALRGVATLGNQQTEKTLFQSTLTFNKVLKKHNFNGVIGATAEDYTAKTQNASTQSFTTDITGTGAIQSGAVVQTPTSDVSTFTLLSSIFRMNYHYDYKYYLTMSARYDGSSKFAEGNKFGFFPSLGLSWRITKEKWFKVPAINELKLRGSIGEVGNQAIGPYNTLSTLSYAGAVFGGSVNTGYVPSRIANPDSFWERTKQINAGIDLSLFKSRIIFTADAYQRKTSKLLYQITLPGTAGFSNLLQNIATLDNKGLDLSLSTVNLNSGDFKWTTDFNISFNTNKITKLSGRDNEFLSILQLNGTASFLSRIQAGGPLGRFYGYKTIGVWNDQTILTKPNTFQTGVVEGDRRYEDVNNDGLLNDLDRSYIGSALPKYYGGFNTAFTYKNLSLSTFFSYSVGNQVFNQLNWNVSGTGGFNNILKEVYDQRYIPITATTDPAKIDAIRANNLVTKATAAGSRMSPAEVTDYYVEDGSYLRCKDITLSYTFPEKIMKRLKVSNLSVFGNWQNPFTITGYSGFNPEVNTGSGLARGLDNGSYPLAKTVRVGLNVGF